MAPVKPPKITILKHRCKQCYNCVRACTAFEGVYEIGDDGYPYPARPELCVHCLICQTVCPARAIVHEEYREVTLIDPTRHLVEMYRNMV